MKYERIYLDLDRTILDTPLFSSAVIAAVEQEYHIAAEDFETSMPNFYIRHGSMQYYDFFAHITMLGLDEQEVEGHLRGVLRGGDFLYPDARLLLKFLRDAPVEVAILSYGPHNYQSFKRSFLPEVRDLPFTATLLFKEDYLAAQDPRPSLLVDDKLVAPLPGWCGQFVIDRAAPAARTQEGERLWRINSLVEVESALMVEYNERNQKEIR